MPELVDDGVKIALGGQELTGWTDAEITMGIDQLADTFSLSGPFDPEDTALVKAVEPEHYQPCAILLGRDTYLTGRLEVLSFDPDASSRPMSLQGRSLPGILADCSTEPELTSEVIALTFAQIARERVCKPFGLKVRDDDPESASRVIPEARADWGEDAFDFLHKLAAPHNLLLNSAYDGRLVITHGDALVGYPLRATLVEGDPYIKSVRASFDGSKRYSAYKIGTTFADAPDATGSATDPSIPIYRPKYKAEEEVDDDLDATAARMMSEYVSSSRSIIVTLVGWRRPDGGLWSERQIVSLKYPSAYLFKAARYVIAGLTLKLSPKDGYTSELRLVPPEAYSTKLVKAKKAKVDLW